MMFVNSNGELAFDVDKNRFCDNDNDSDSDINDDVDRSLNKTKTLF